MTCRSCREKPKLCDEGRSCETPQPEHRAKRTVSVNCAQLCPKLEIDLIELGSAWIDSVAEKTEEMGSEPSAALLEAEHAEEVAGLHPRQGGGVTSSEEEEE